MRVREPLYRRGRDRDGYRGVIGVYALNSLFENGKNFSVFFINCTREFWFWLSDFGMGVALGSVRGYHYYNF